MSDVDPRWLANAVAAVRALEAIYGPHQCIRGGGIHFSPVEIDWQEIDPVAGDEGAILWRPSLVIHTPCGSDQAVVAAALRAALAEKVENARRANAVGPCPCAAPHSLPCSWPDECPLLRREHAKEEPMYRYEVRDDVVLDRTTGLEWRRTHAGQMTWLQAADYAAKEGYGWRLPTVEELITLIDFSLHGPASAFPQMPLECFWSSSSYAGSASSAWYVYFYYGNVLNSNKTLTHYVRCVRRRGDSTPTATEKREGRCGTCARWEGNIKEHGVECSVIGVKMPADGPLWECRGWRQGP